MSLVELGRESRMAAEQINAYMDLDTRLELIKKIIHFNHGLIVSKKLPQHRHHFIHLITNKEQATRWVKLFPNDIEYNSIFYKDITSFLDDTNLVNIVTHNKRLLTRLSHLITVFNAGQLMTLCPNKAKFIVMKALENNKCKLYEKSSFDCLKIQPNLCNTQKHNLDYFKHLFTLE